MYFFYCFDSTKIQPWQAGKKPKLPQILHRAKKSNFGKKSRVFQSKAKPTKTNLTSILHQIKTKNGKKTDLTE